MVGSASYKIKSSMYYKILIIKRYKNRTTVYKGRYAILCEKNSAKVLYTIEKILEKEGFQKDSVYFDICFNKDDVKVCIDYDVDGIIGTPYKLIRIEDLYKYL